MCRTSFRGQVRTRLCVKVLWALYGICLYLFIGIMGCGNTVRTIQPLPVAPAEVDAILSTLQVRYDLTGSLKITEMVVRIEEGDQREELWESLWYKRSGAGGELLQVQAKGPYNEPRGVAIANRDKNQFLLYLLNEQRAYHGTLSDGALREIFGMDLRISDVLSTIFGNPFLDGRTAHFTSVEKSGAKFTVTRPGVHEGYVETIIIFIRDGEPRVTEWYIHDADQRLQQHVTFSDYRDVSSILRPHSVEIERPPEQTRVTVNIGRVELNVEISDSKFDVEPFLMDAVEIIPLSE